MLSGRDTTTPTASPSCSTTRARRPAGAGSAGGSAALRTATTGAISASSSRTCALVASPQWTIGEAPANTSTRLLRDMERDGLVRREPDLDDRRRTLVVLTPRGRGLVDRARGHKIALFAAALRAQPAGVARSAEDVIALLDGLSHE